MKLSIITVCWNSDKYLKDAIESVLAQKYNNIEYIIIDGGSTDRTLEIIKHYEPLFAGRMKWISEKDKGIYDAMNKGIRMSSGEVVGLINSDDFFIDDSALEKVMKVFSEKNVESVYADLYYVHEKNTNSIARKWITGEKKSFRSGWHPAHPTFYVKKHVYENYGFFDLQYRIAADFELMLRFLERYNISSYYLKEFIVKMRLGGESNKSFTNINKGNREIRQSFTNNNISFPLTYTAKRWLKKILQYIN